MTLGRARGKFESEPKSGPIDFFGAWQRLAHFVEIVPDPAVVRHVRQVKADVWDVLGEAIWWAPLWAWRLWAGRQAGPRGSLG